MSQAGIQLYPGASGSADDQVTALLEGRLVYNPDTLCQHHHGEGHTCSGHEEGHSCGDHACGNHGA